MATLNPYNPQSFADKVTQDKKSVKKVQEAGDPKTKTCPVKVPSSTKKSSTKKKGISPNDILGIASKNLSNPSKNVNNHDWKKFCTDWGIPKGTDWCVIWIWWIFWKAGASKLFCNGTHAADCGQVYNWGVSKNAILVYDRLTGKGNIKNGKPGDILLMRSMDGTVAKAHVGIIVENKGKSGYRTVEGNVGGPSDGVNTPASSYVYYKDSKALFRSEPLTMRITSIFRPRYEEDFTPTTYGYSSDPGSSSKGSVKVTDLSKNKITSKYKSSLKAFKKSSLEQAKRGTYVDGEAPTPYVMMELRASESTSGSYHSLSIPADNFVSLTHERHMFDSYNKFSIQLFDKNAKQVEAWLVLGFRYLSFYYTDFVSRSKRFSGMILDYKTTIAGKGLMLTLEGYTTDSSLWLENESIPWSQFFSSNYLSFYYWTNKAGEYLGEVYYYEAMKGDQRITDPNHEPGTKEGMMDAIEGTKMYNSTMGVVASPKWKEIADELNKKDVDYYLQWDNAWIKWTEFYSKTEGDLVAKYKPYPEQYKLSSYNVRVEANIKDIYKSVFNKEPTYDDITKKCPHNVFLLICAVAGWKVGKVTKTREVPEIPDQVSMSYTQYIKDKLCNMAIPADGSTKYTQFAFYFDDNGCACFVARDADSAPSKYLYFNAPDKKDTYPLIGFTASSNGSVLMATDATQVMNAINVYTGDPLVASASLQRTDDKKYANIINTAPEWYTTASINLNKGTGSNLSLIKYKSPSVVPSQSELESALESRYGTISQYSYKASLDVYACVDIVPGDNIDISIFLDDDSRDYSDVVQHIGDKVNGSGQKEALYKGNVSKHHTSGKYIVQKVTDNISAGKFISTLEVFKMKQDNVVEIVSGTDESLSVKKEDKTPKEAATEYTAGGGGYSRGGGGSGSFGGSNGSTEIPASLYDPRSQFQKDAESVFSGNNGGIGGR